MKTGTSFNFKCPICQVRKHLVYNMKNIKIMMLYCKHMKTWHVAATFSISLVLLLGMQTSVFAESEDGSKSCPFKGGKAGYEKSNADYSEKHQSGKITSTSIDENQIPSWFKSNAKWWSNGQLNDSEFTTGIKFLIDQEIISISGNNISQEISSEIQTPHWIKTTAGWWADGLVSEAEFVSGLEHLANNGII